MAYYGRRVTAGDTDIGSAGGAYPRQRGQRFSPITVHGWATAMGFWAGKSSAGDANISTRLAIWAANMGARKQYTSAFTVSAVMGSGSEGQAYEAALLSPLQLWANTEYSLGLIASSGTLNFAMREAALGPIGVVDYYFHSRDVAGGIPTDPFNATANSYQGAKDIWVIYTPNTAPTVTTVGAAPTGTIPTATPTFTGAFADAESSLGDKLKQYKIEVRQVGQTTLVWAPTLSADSAEQAANAFSELYAGSTLTAGVPYEWRYQVSDQFNQFSAWSSWITFTVNGGGSFDVSAGNPTGKQESVTPANFTGVWSHPSGFSTQAYEVRIKQGGTIVRTMASPRVFAGASGATFSLSWANTGFAALSWGVAYTYEMRGQDSTGLWSPWSAGRAFSTNASPTIPSQLSPTGGAVSSSRPLLTCLSTDADDTTGTGFAVSARIKDSAGAVLFTRAMALNGTTGLWEYQTTSTDLATFADYRWDAVATDGTLTTAYSTESTFTYAQGPIITQSAPANGSTIVTNVPTFSFSPDIALSAWQLWIVQNSTGETVFDTGTVVEAIGAGATKNYTLASGYLHNTIAYTSYISGTASVGGLVGTSTGNSFTLSFPAPEGPQNYQVSALRVGNDVTASAAQIAWDLPNYSSDKFQFAIVTRREDGQDISQALVLARLSSVSQNIFIDYYPPSGGNYVYSTYFIVVQGTDVTESTAIEQSITLALDHVVINSVLDGEVRAGLRYGQPLKLDANHDSVMLKAWGAKRPHSFVGSQRSWLWSSTFELHNDRYSTGKDDAAGLLELYDSGVTVCYRDQAGNRIFGELQLTITWAIRGMVAQVFLTITETDYAEGEA